jgi:hypothetical protein
MNFEIIGPILNFEKLSEGNSIREIDRLRKCYGNGNWKKMKGIARIQLLNGQVRLAELHCIGTKLTESEKRTLNVNVI